MKRRLLFLTLAMTCSCVVTFAQEFQTSGSWRRIPSEYKDQTISMVDKFGDDYVVTLTYFVAKEGLNKKKLAVVDENMHILRLMDYNERIIPPVKKWEKDGNLSTGPSCMMIKNGNLEHLYADWDNTRECRVLTRNSYDLTSMNLIKSEELMCATNLEPNGSLKSMNRRRFYDFDDFKVQWSENGEYVGLITYHWYLYQRCFNLVLYDHQFNKLAEAKGLDTFQLPKLKYKEFSQQFQDYYYDFTVSNDGRMTFVRSVSKRFLQSDGSDVAVFELSKDGYKRHDFGKVMGKCQFYSPDLLQVKDGKALVFGIYAPVADQENMKMEGHCTLELDLGTNTVRQVEKTPFEEAFSVSWGMGYMPQGNYFEPSGRIWNTSKGWIKILNLHPSSITEKNKYRIAFLDENGCIRSIYPLNKNADSYTRFVYNDKLYYAVFLKDYLISIGEDGKEEQHPIPYSHHLYKDYDHSLRIFFDDKKGTWPFFKTDANDFMFGKLQISGS